MKILKATLFCLLFAGIGQVNAQIDATINPIGLLWANFSLGADFGITEDFSIEGLVGFGAGNEDIADYNAFNVTANGKYYFNPKEGADRFYAFGFLRYVTRNYDYGNDSGFVNYNQNRIGLGVGAGTKIVSTKGFVFDINLGAGRALVDNTTYDDGNGAQQTLDWPDLMFAGKLAIGYRF